MSVRSYAVGTFTPGNGEGSNHKTPKRGVINRENKKTPPANPNSKTQLRKQNRSKHVPHRK